MKKEALTERYMKLKIGKLQRKADQVYRLKRRMEEANDCGIVRCISCSTEAHYKNVDCGHFIPCGHKGTRYNDLNNWPQCKKCNKWLSGNHAVYRENLIKKIGTMLVEDLEKIKNFPPQKNLQTYREFLIEVIFDSKAKVKKLEKEL